MNKELQNRIYDAARRAFFEAVFEKDYVRFEAHLFGEDISFEVYADDFDDIFSEVKSNYEFFDVEEHAVMLWHTHGESEETKDLMTSLNDAQAIKMMYGNLCLHLNDLRNELEGK